ncbi:MAG: YebC/PmpR family DNA-binding transcriptional regulator [Bacteroidales bacterium]
MVNYKEKKGAADAKRSKIFSKIIKDITVAVKRVVQILKESCSQLAIANAKGASMPKDNIERLSTKKRKGFRSFSELTYEGYLSHRYCRVY